MKLNRQMMQVQVENKLKEVVKLLFWQAVIRLTRPGYVSDKLELKESRQN
jgi:hypothetical protein